MEHACVNSSCQEVVSGCDGVDVSGEVQVHLLHGDDLHKAFWHVSLADSYSVYIWISYHIIDLACRPSLLAGPFYSEALLSSIFQSEDAENNSTGLMRLETPMPSMTDAYKDRNF